MGIPNAVVRLGFQVIHALDQKLSSTRHYLEVPVQISQKYRSTQRSRRLVAASGLFQEIELGISKKRRSPETKAN
jgi:hypothetical protein